MSSDRGEAVIRDAYAAFNERDIERAVAVMDPDVIWPNVIEGGVVHGREGVRRHWREVFESSQPQVELGSMRHAPDGSVAIEVRQTVANGDGQIVSDDRLIHVVHLEDGLITRLDVEPDV